MSTTFAEVVHVRVEVVVPVGRGRAQRLLVRNALHAGERGLEQLVGPRLDPAVTSVSAGPPLGGLYLKPPSSGGLCDGVITIPSASPARAPPVVAHDGMRHRRRRRELVVLGEHHVHAVRREHLERGGAGRRRQRVRVEAEKERAVDPVAPAIAADRPR